MYAVDHGVYPKNLKELQKEAKARAYWRSFDNPYTSRLTSRLVHLPPFGNMADWKKVVNYKLRTVKYLFGLRVRAEEHPEIKTMIEKHIGRVLYAYMSPTHYRVYGVDGEGKLIVSRGKIFYLSNE